MALIIVTCFLVFSFHPSFSDIHPFFLFSHSTHLSLPLPTDRSSAALGKKLKKMNDLMSSSFSFPRDQGDQPSTNGGAVEMEATAINLAKFFKDVDGIKDEIREVESIHQRLRQSNESSKILHNAQAVKDLRARMAADVRQALKRAKLIHSKLSDLDRANVANWTEPGCGPGSSADRTRTSVVSSLRQKLADLMAEFRSLREHIASDYRETVERRYYTVTGEKPEEKTVEILISTGESENFMKKAIEEQGRGQVLDAIMELQERHDAAKEIEKNLLELHQIFLDMAVLVQAQGEQLDDIESHVARARSYVQRGTNQLQIAKKNQRNTRKWTFFGILIILILAAILAIIISRLIS
ncbi:hypothetical protein ACLOJK_032705 [Asimina triloba]